MIVNACAAQKNPKENVMTEANAWQMIVAAGPVVKAVLLLLFFISIFSWAIIFYKLNLLRKIERETRFFYRFFAEGAELKSLMAASKTYRFTPLARMAEELRPASGAEAVKRTLKKAAERERAAMERAVPFLATTANTAPFIGLFGTVWGIMNTFRSIGERGGANLAVVAPGIAEALVATAMGLLAAIPAVVAFNHITVRIDRVSGEMERFSTDLINMMESSERSQ
jgi:biopolymer transport protein TolQ